MATQNIRDANIHYRVLGERGPWLALITGGRRGFTEFVPLAEKISAHGVRVLLHDRRNTGASDVVIDGADGEEEIWTDDLYELLGRRGPVAPMYGVTEAQLGSIRVPAVVIPGNDKTHSMACGRAIQRLIPGSRLVELPLEDQDLPLVPFPDWAPHEQTIARVCAEFVLKNT